MYRGRSILTWMIVFLKGFRIFFFTKGHLKFSKTSSGFVVSTILRNPVYASATLYSWAAATPEEKMPKRNENRLAMIRTRFTYLTPNESVEKALSKETFFLNLMSFTCHIEYHR